MFRKGLQMKQKMEVPLWSNCCSAAETINTSEAPYLKLHLSKSIKPIDIWAEIFLCSSTLPTNVSVCFVY